MPVSSTVRCCRPLKMWPTASAQGAVPRRVGARSRGTPAHDVDAAAASPKAQPAYSRTPSLPVDSPATFSTTSALGLRRALGLTMPSSYGTTPHHTSSTGGRASAPHINPATGCATHRGDALRGCPQPHLQAYLVAQRLIDSLARQQARERRQQRSEAVLFDRRRRARLQVCTAPAVHQDHCWGGRSLSHGTPYGKNQQPHAGGQAPPSHNRVAASWLGLL